MPGQVKQHPARVVRVIRGQTKLGAVLEDRGEAIERPWADDAPLEVAPLGPRIRVQDEQPTDRRLVQAGQQQPRIVGKEADIVEPAPGNPAQEAGHAVDKGFAADEPDLRMGGGLRGQVLAGAEANLEPDLGDAGRKKSSRVKRGSGFVGQADLEPGQ